MNISDCRWIKHCIFVFIIFSVIYFSTEETWSLEGSDAANKSQKVSESGEGINFIRGVNVVQSGDKTEIIVSADRSFDADTLIIENKKLVIDVKNVSPSIALQDMSVENNKLISKIRIGKSDPPEHKVRIVADLREQIAYVVNKGEKTLTVDVRPKNNKHAEPPAVLIAQVQNNAETQPSAKTLEKIPEKIKPVSVKEVQTPQVVLVAATASSIPSRFTGKKVSLDFQDADITNVLRLLSEVSKLNMIIGENVKGKITIKMSNVPWDQALDVILKLKGLGKVFEDNVLRIDTLSNIAQSQEDEARAKDAMIKAEDLEIKIIPVNYAKAKDILESVKKTLSPRGDVTVDERTNTIILKDIRYKHDEVIKFLKILDKPTAQVLIEARIVQADSNFARDLGVQWGGTYATNPGTYNIGIMGGPTGTVGAPTSGFAVNLPAQGVAGTKGSMGITIGKGNSFNLDLRLSAGESKGVTKVLSAPKITTLDNREATIQQGEAIPYKTLSQEGTKTEFIDATLTLKVTPKVTPDGHIAMAIKISKNRQGSIVVEGTPSINKKEATTEVLVKDGETTVIGGIYESTDVDNLNGVPWFYRVPILGWLFKNTQQSNIKSELLIFITPKIIPVTI